MGEGTYYNNLLDIFHEKKLVKICAPMVRYSKLQFRSLVREYGCDLCFTPMILADSFCQSEKARHNEFATNLMDQPLVMQFAANTVHDFVGAAHLASPFCNGVDLNCGCPQRWAKCQGIGCVMLENPELIYDIVRGCRNHISKPFTVSVKMRILSDLKKSVDICQKLEHCGVSFLTVHGRTAIQRNDEVNIEALRLISDSVQCPVIANGGCKSLDNVLQLQEESNCKGVMVANGLLTNPALFTGANVTPLDCVQRWVDICFNSTIDCCNLDSNYSVISPSAHIMPERNKTLTFQCFLHHLVFMLEKILPKKSRRIFNNLQSFQSVLEFLNDTFNIKPNIFSVKHLENYKSVWPNYENRNDKYLELAANSLELETADSLEMFSAYDPNLTDGNFFNSKKSINDNYDSCISSLFLEI